MIRFCSWTFNYNFLIRILDLVLSRSYEWNTELCYYRSVEGGCGIGRKTERQRQQDQTKNNIMVWSLIFFFFKKNGKKRRNEREESTNRLVWARPFLPSIFSPFCWLWTRPLFFLSMLAGPNYSLRYHGRFALVVRLDPLALFLGVGLIKASQEKAHNWGSAPFSWPKSYAMDWCKLPYGLRWKARP